MVRFGVVGLSLRESLTKISIKIDLVPRTRLY